MPDYGQDLQFGTFLTPDAARADRVVELALLTEAAGLDLATIQDHPYQGRFLDAWALIATILARSSTLRVTTNVSNLPLRPPYVLAKTVASLDVLSRGRVELGIGAGALLGRDRGRRRPASYAGGGAGRAGRGHRRDPARPGQVGPAPLHDVEIWIGAIGPRMLELTGRVGDGWLPSQSYVPPDTLAERNARIDDAALAAGRDPSAVRRLYNVNPSDDPAWPEWLAELTLTHGISTFIVAGDDPGTIQRFGTEVAPAVRELVAAERAGAPGRAPPPAPAPVEVRARRRRRAADGRRRRTPQRAVAVGRVDPPDVRLAATRRWPGPRRSGPPASTSSTCTTTCARSSRSSST